MDRCFLKLLISFAIARIRSIYKINFVINNTHTCKKHYTLLVWNYRQNIVTLALFRRTFCKTGLHTNQLWLFNKNFLRYILMNHVMQNTIVQLSTEYLFYFIKNVQKILIKIDYWAFFDLDRLFLSLFTVPQNIWKHIFSYLPVFHYFPKKTPHLLHDLTVQGSFYRFKKTKRSDLFTAFSKDNSTPRPSSLTSLIYSCILCVNLPRIPMLFVFMVIFKHGYIRPAVYGRIQTALIWEVALACLLLGARFLQPIKRTNRGSHNWATACCTLAAALRFA